MIHFTLQHYQIPQLTQPLGQKLLTNVSIITYDVNKYHFEIIAYQNKLLAWKKHLEKDINKVLQSTDIYSNVELGLFINNQSLLDVFETTDKLKICTEILQNGKTRYSVAEQTQETNRKLNEISNLIFQRIINPNTQLPYPRTLIKRYITDVLHYNINNFPASEQAGIIIKQMRENNVIFELSDVNVIVCLQNVEFIQTIQNEIQNFNQKNQSEIFIENVVGNLIFLRLQSGDLSFVKNLLVSNEISYRFVVW